MLNRRYHYVPSNFHAEFNFHLSPLWLRILARTPFLDRYAYPIAKNLGLAELWPNSSDSTLDPDFDVSGWIIHNREKNDFEKWIEGSFAYLDQGETKRVTQFFYVRRSWKVGPNHSISWRVLPSLSLTAYGLNLSRRREIHKYNGTYRAYKRALQGDHFDFSE